MGGTAEVESALVGAVDVAEAAVVGIPDDLKGQALYAFVTLKAGVEPTKELRASLRGQVRTALGPFCAPDTIHWAPGLPKTSSGKITGAFSARSRKRENPWTSPTIWA